MCYGLTAVISFAVVALIVGVNAVMNRAGGNGAGSEEGGE